MGRPQKQPTNLTCRQCHLPLPHGQRDPITKRLYRADMTFCPYPDATCKDEWHNQADPARLTALAIGRKTYLSAEGDANNFRAGDEPFTAIQPKSNAARYPDKRDDGVISYGRAASKSSRPFGRVAAAIRAKVIAMASRQPGYEQTLAIQSGDAERLRAVIEVTALGEQVAALQEVQLEQQRQIARARDFQRLSNQYLLPSTGPAPTGAQCPNCLQPDTDHMPGCAYESGVDVDAVAWQWRRPRSVQNRVGE